MHVRIALLALTLTAACQSTGTPEAAIQPPPHAPNNVMELLEQAQFELSCNLTFEEQTVAQLESIPVKPIGPAELGLFQVGEEQTKAHARGEERFEIIVLEHASAPELAHTLNRLMHAVPKGSRIGRLEVHADQRTNSLLVAGNSDQIEPLKVLVTHLDVELQHDDA